MAEPKAKDDKPQPAPITPAALATAASGALAKSGAGTLVLAFVLWHVGTTLSNSVAQLNAGIEANTAAIFILLQQAAVKHDLSWTNEARSGTRVPTYLEHGGSYGNIPDGRVPDAPYWRVPSGLPVEPGRAANYIELLGHG